MAQKLVELLSPLMDELSPILGPLNDKLFYSYSLTNEGMSTNLSTFTILFRSTLKLREKNALIQKLVRHSTKKNQKIIDKLLISSREIVIQVQNSCVSFLVYDMLKESNLADPTRFPSFPKSSTSNPPNVASVETD